MCAYGLCLLRGTMVVDRSVLPHYARDDVWPLVVFVMNYHDATRRQPQQTIAPANNAPLSYRQ
jgi:hypothetical protein